MQTAEVVLNVLRERGRKGLPCTQLYRQMFNEDLYLLAYGNIYSNDGAMTPGASEETADGMSEAKIEQITGLMRREKYRFSPARRVYIPKKNGRLRPLGMPTWSDKLVGEVVRLLLEAYYDPQFSDSSHGFRKSRGCQPRVSLRKSCERACRQPTRRLAPSTPVTVLSAGLIRMAGAGPRCGGLPGSRSRAGTVPAPSR